MRHHYALQAAWSSHRLGSAGGATVPGSPTQGKRGRQAWTSARPAGDVSCPAHKSQHLRLLDFEGKIQALVEHFAGPADFSSAPPSCSTPASGPGHRMLIARAMTRAARARDTIDSKTIISLAQTRTADTSVGLNARAVLNDRTR